ncbi:high affinity immunoglobulin epsilon receptor subunit gamma isoform X1 [Boleophthalmus pectinirostris]|uniref:high affinity immunoglobulin epsilon receptor subunit gamma isoform X1 n=1 Tax=Boleophthalmus pectinirostris TaxID=150288 RepID=UPI000A1C2709|nr:high affinity immunoglobulin epsilon receptor subunit gamma isoform X1 [Boleophthalmus pectinirostris]
MGCIKIVVSVLLVLLNPTSCNALSYIDPMICYILDGVLIFYCIVATALFFREKLSHQVPKAVPDSSGGIYQELGESRNADPYEVLDTFQKKKKKKKSKGPQSAGGAGAEPVPGTSSA